MDNKSLKEEKLVATKGSLISSINSFEKTLLDMKSTVLVPTRLNDIDCETMVKTGINNTSDNNENLFDVYSDLDRMRKILYGDKSRSDNKNFNQNEINGNDKNCINLNIDSSDNDIMTKIEFHVKSLRSLLDQLSGTAEYITKIYKDDIQNMHMNHIIEFNNEIKHYYTSNTSDNFI